MSSFLDRFAAYIREKNYNVLRIAEIRHGNEPKSLELQPCNPCQNSYSVAKAFVVTAIGMLCDHGLLRVEDKITDVLADILPANIDPRWHDATVDDVLLHKCGLPGGFLDIDVNDIQGYGRDFLRYLFTYPLLDAPGTTRRYTDGAYYLLARVVEEKAGKPLDLFLWETFFFDAGFQEVAWSRCPMGHPIGATGLYIRAEDMAKLGEVYRTGGCYANKRFLSEDWVRFALEKPYELSPNEGGRSFSKGGMRGQYLLVIPGQNRTVAWHSYENTDNGVLTRWIEENG